MLTDERRPAPNKGALSSPKDHVIDLCDINASLLPRPGIEPGPAAWQARTLALRHVSGLDGFFFAGSFVMEISYEHNMGVNVIPAPQ